MIAVIVVNGVAQAGKYDVMSKGKRSGMLTIPDTNVTLTKRLTANGLVDEVATGIVTTFLDAANLSTTKFSNVWIKQGDYIDFNLFPEYSSFIVDSNSAFDAYSKKDAVYNIVLAKYPITMLEERNVFLPDEEYARLATAFYTAKKLIAEAKGKDLTFAERRYYTEELRMCNSYLTGYAGFGKSTIVEAMAQMFGLSYKVVPMGTICDVAVDMGGSHTLSGGNSKFKLSAFAKDVLNPDIDFIIFDEMNRAGGGNPTVVTNALLRLLNEGEFIIPGSFDEDSMGVMKLPIRFYSCTVNEGREYGTGPMERALEDRFPIKLIKNEIAEQAEIRLLMNVGVSANDASTIVKWARLVRDSYSKGEVNNYPSPRKTQYIARQVSYGLSPENAIRQVISEYDGTNTTGDRAKLAVHLASAKK